MYCHNFATCKSTLKNQSSNCNSHNCFRSGIGQPVLKLVGSVNKSDGCAFTKYLDTADLPDGTFELFIKTYPA